MLKPKPFLPMLMLSALSLLLLLMISLSKSFVMVSQGRSIFDKNTMIASQLSSGMRPTVPAASRSFRTRMAASIGGEERNDSRLATATLIAEEWIHSFSRALSSGRVDDVLDLFVEDPEEDYVGPLPEGKTQKQFPAFWRDMVAYTWNIVTLEGKDSIRDMLKETLKNNRGATSWKLAEPRPSGREFFPPPPKVTVDCDDDDASICEFWCDITTVEGTGYAHIRLDTKTKRATTLLTTLLDLHDQPVRTHDKRPRGSIPGPVPGRPYFHKQQRDQNNSEEENYHVAIVGAGQAGLSLAARLEAMGVPYVLFEAGSSPGSSWRNARYPSLYLHDPVWYQHLPYLEFPKTWPVFTPKDKLADWMDAYATLMDLNLKTNTRVTKATEEYEDQEKTWRIETISTNNDSDSTKVSAINARHVVFATGNSSRPKIPNFPGASSTFRGVQLHTSRYTGGKVFAGKRVVVIGSNNSGFDVCQDLWEQGAGSVTMIQRTGSMIVSSDSVLKYGLFLFNEDPQYHHEDADLLLTTTPYRILAEGGGWEAVTNKMKDNDRDLIARVEASGYKFDYGYEGTGLFAKSATEGGGFYIDVGCAELLARNDVGVRYADVERLESDAVIIFNKDSGEEESLPADVVVYATGFDTMESYVEQICGRDVVDKVGKTWGLGLDYKPNKDPGPWTGELRNMWKPTNVEGLWFHGGNLAQCRHYSKFLALQLAARYRAKVGGDIANSISEDSSQEASSAFIGEDRVYGIPPPAFIRQSFEPEIPASIASSI